MRTANFPSTQLTPIPENESGRGPMQRGHFRAVNKQVSNIVLFIHGPAIFYVQGVVDHLGSVCT